MYSSLPTKPQTQKIQSVEGETAGLQTLKSFTWQINHYQLSSHIQIGDVYGETASGEKVKLFDAKTAELKGGDDGSAEGNYLFKSGSEANCFTVTKQSTKNNFSTASAQDGWREFPLPFANLPTDLSDYAGFSFYVANSSDKPVFFNKFLTEKTAQPGLKDLGSGKDLASTETERWYDDVNVGNLLPDGGETEYNARCQTIAANWSGRVFVPFSAFKTPSWKTLPDGASRLDLNDIASLTLSFNISGSYAKTEFELNDFRLEETIEVPVKKMTYYQWENGVYKEAIPSEEKFNDGAEFTPQNEITFNGNTYVLDETLSHYTGEDKAAYSNNAARVRRDGGAVSYNFRPKLYYKLKGNFTLEKAFYPKAIIGELPKGSNADEIAEGLPGGFTFGNQFGGLMEIKGAWSVTNKTDSSATFVFTPSEIPSNITVADDGVFTKTVAISTAVAPTPNLTGIKINTPMKTQFLQGSPLELAGLIVIATFDDGTTTALKPDDYSVSGFDTSKTGEQTITVTAGGNTATFTVTVIENPDYKPVTDGEGDGNGGCGQKAAAVIPAFAVLLAAMFIRRK